MYGLSNQWSKYAIQTNHLETKHKNCHKLSDRGRQSFIVFKEKYS